MRVWQVEFWKERAGLSPEQRAAAELQVTGFAGFPHIVS